MSGGSEAVEILAEAMGVAPVTVRQQSRALREHEPPLWIRAGSGRRNVHVNLSHLVNLLIASAAGAPADAAANVQLYRSLTAEDGTEFGLFLDALVDRLALRQSGVAGAEGGTFFVKLILGDAPSATIAQVKDNISDLSWVFRPPQDDLLLKQTEATKFTRLIHLVAIPHDLLDVLAQLWRDSIAHGAGAEASDDPNAKTRNADLPARKSASDRTARKQPVSLIAAETTRAAGDVNPFLKGHARDSRKPDPTSRRQS